MNYSEFLTLQESAPLGHSAAEAVIEDIKPATCTEDGIRADVVYCTRCGKELSRKERIMSSLGGHHTELINQKEATEDEDGYTGDTYCTVCGQIIEYGEVIEKLEPTTEETTAEETTEEEITSTIEETTEAAETTENNSETHAQDNPSKNCSHICHSSSKFLQFFWKIINFFNKLLRINKYCDCGVAHY